MMIEQITVAELVAVGGAEWQTNGMHRVYFNDLPKWYGLEYGRYNTGNIQWARLDGEKISNGQAGRYLADLGGKVYYDAVAGGFRGRDIEQGYLDEIAGAIRKAVAAKRAAVPVQA